MHYIMTATMDDGSVLQHANLPKNPRKKHKYLYIDKNGNYIYADDVPTYDSGVKARPNTQGGGKDEGRYREQMSTAIAMKQKEDADREARRQAMVRNRAERRSAQAMPESARQAKAYAESWQGRQEQAVSRRDFASRAGEREEARKRREIQANVNKSNNKGQDGSKGGYTEVTNLGLGDASRNLANRLTEILNNINKSNNKGQASSGSGYVSSTMSKAQTKTKADANKVQQQIDQVKKLIADAVAAKKKKR